MFSRISKKKKILLIFSIFGILVYAIINSSLEKVVKENIKFWVDDNINYRLDIITGALKKSKSYNSRYYNDYNEEFLPKTQFNNLSFEKKTVLSSLVFVMSYLTRLIFYNIFSTLGSVNE